jgi:putative FmdB family regulatory protein
MPIYEYKCNKCGVFEAMQGIKEAPLKKCPTCKSKVERQISRGSFILKGSGWYATDYAKKSTPGSTESESASSATPAANGSSATSSDSSSKPATESKPAAESKSSSSESKASTKTKSASEKSVSAKAAD